MNQTSKSLYDRIGGRETLTVLLRHFYADVWQHELIGPIFNRQIKDWIGRRLKSIISSEEATEMRPTHSG